MSMDIKMKVNIAGVEWKKPGYSGVGDIRLRRGIRGLCGSEPARRRDDKRRVANVPWAGNPTPRVAETYGGMMNAVGLQNPGH